MPPHKPRGTRYQSMKDSIRGASCNPWNCKTYLTDKVGICLPSRRAQQNSSPSPSWTYQRHGHSGTISTDSRGYTRQESGPSNRSAPDYNSNASTRPIIKVGPLGIMYVSTNNNERHRERDLRDLPPIIDPQSPPCPVHLNIGNQAARGLGSAANQPQGNTPSKREASGRTTPRDRKGKVDQGNPRQPSCPSDTELSRHSKTGPSSNHSPEKSKK